MVFISCTELGAGLIPPCNARCSSPLAEILKGPWIVWTIETIGQLADYFSLKEIAQHLISGMHKAVFEGAHHAAHSKEYPPGLGSWQQLAQSWLTSTGRQRRAAPWCGLPGLLLARSPQPVSCEQWRWRSVLKFHELCALFRTPSFKHKGCAAYKDINSEQSHDLPHDLIFVLIELCSMPAYA